jgi:hypothetical protein
MLDCSTTNQNPFAHLNINCVLPAIVVFEALINPDIRAHVLRQLVSGNMPEGRFVLGGSVR